MATAKTPARRPARRTLAMTDKGTTLTVVPTTPKKRTPKAPSTTPKATAKALETAVAKKGRGRPAASTVEIPEDVDELFRALKSAKGVLWTINNRAKVTGSDESAKIAAQEEKVATLQEAYDVVRPERAGSYDGPAAVVSVDSKGNVYAERAEDAAGVKALRDAATAGGYVVLSTVRIP